VVTRLGGPRDPHGACSTSSTSVIPIVFAAVGDPVGTGLVTSLARPGGIPAEMTKARRPLTLRMVDVVHSLLVARQALGRDRFVFPANSASGHVEDPALDKVAERCGVYVSPHDLRRTYVTIAESCDISIMALKALLNHSGRIAGSPPKLVSSLFSSGRSVDGRVRGNR
jgi:hypothetical protein